MQRFGVENRSKTSALVSEASREGWAEQEKFSPGEKKPSFLYKNVKLDVIYFLPSPFISGL